MENKEVDEDQARKINYQISKNKGLTRQKKKIDSNSRVKLKVKYNKKMQKQKVFIFIILMANFIINFFYINLE